MTDHGTLMLFGVAETRDVDNTLANLRTCENGIGWSLSATIGHCHVSPPSSAVEETDVAGHGERCDYAACDGVLYYQLPLRELIMDFEDHVTCLANLIVAFTREHHASGADAPARLVIGGEFTDRQALQTESLRRDEQMRLHLLEPVLELLRKLHPTAPVFGAPTRDAAIRLCALALDDLAGNEAARTELWRSQVRQLTL